MAEIPVRVELRTTLPVSVRSLPALEQLVLQAMSAHGVPSSEATMRQDGPDLVMCYDLAIEEPDDGDA